MVYLITGATGTIGALVVEQLLEQGERPRVFVRNKEKAHARYGGRVDVFEGDLADGAGLTPALRGADALLLVNSGPQLATRDARAANAAKAAGVKHLVKLSSYDALQHVGTGVWHAQGESMIRESGVPFTFVRPSGFMSNALLWAKSIQEHGVVSACTGDGQISFVHPRDIAQVATAALISGNFQGESLAITGAEALSYAEMAARIGRAIGRTITFESISEEQVRRQMAASGDSLQEIDAHLSIYRAIREGRLATVTRTVAHVLGREPAAFDEWVVENASVFSEPLRVS
jgi:uncharacterized protein YbjT (DUF2867 family)